ncbi:MAG: MBOAT family protein [Chitinophagaceae bacterium]|nr:MBOAT family protein [Sphingobacteriales bacterium]OJW01586.1 MAG: membrane-bound O-acyltransferase family protein [Sphingobacteriales bacterium 44-61]TXJ27047.1 MAG: MBOAT family protein [Chitinophagaceae bacterium]
MPLFELDAFWKQFLYDKDNPLLFNNGFFVFFFAIFIALYYSFRNNFKVRRYIFCFFSLYFFYKASGYFVGLVILSAIVDFVLSNAIFRQTNKVKKKALLICSIIFNLGLLFYFKYTNFFISVSNDLFHAGFNPLNILLPVGISFYTFENLSYTIDVYRGQFEPAKKFSDYLLFLSFFPKLVMGPIVRAHDFVPQINKPYVITDNDFAKGFYLIISGLFKKLVISDFITLNFVNYIFDDPSRYTGLENLFAVYGYAVVIYCDFSGYSDVAIGIAKWLGFTIPTNFLSPYQSKNITEFWRRWHISLSSWLKDYLYIPLGGNRKSSVGTWIFSLLFFAGVFLAGQHLFGMEWWQAVLLSAGILLIFLLPAIIAKEKKGVAANMNLLTTMLLGGFWHGASWNFIIWGSLHGISLAIHKIWMLLTGRAFKNVKNSWWYNALAILLTFHFVCFCWVFFKAADFDTALAMLHQIGYDFTLSVWPAFANNYWPVLVMMGLAYMLHAIPDDYADRVINRFRRIPLPAYIAVFFVFVVLYGYFKSAEPVMPIYLQF